MSIKLSSKNMSRTREILKIFILFFLLVPLVVNAQTVGVGIKFEKTLQRGMRGKDVKILQEFLKQSPEIYPQGLVTGYFGPLTEMAVKRLQKLQGIEPVGIVGPKTKAKLNELVVETGFSVGGGGQAISATPATPAASGGNGNSATPATPPTPATPAPQSDQPTSTPKGNDPPTSTPSGTMPATPAAPSSAGGPASPAVPATPVATTSSADMTAPVISNVQATSITEISATITWTTNELASSEVQWTTSSPITSTTTIQTASGVNNVISHSVSLTGLSSGRTHYYVVVSKDAAGNSATSSEQSFNTVTSPPPQPSLLPNLTILGFDNPTNVTAGQNVTLKAWVRNAGLVTSSPSELLVALSASPTFDNIFSGAQATLSVPSIQPYSPVAAQNHSNAVWISWTTVIPSTTAGSIYFMAKCDPNNQIVESSETDNGGGTQINVSQQ